MHVEVGWIIKWRSYFGEKVGKVVEIARADDGPGLVGYYVSEQRSTQGLPGVSGPTLVSPRDIIEVVSRGD